MEIELEKIFLHLFILKERNFKLTIFANLKHAQSASLLLIEQVNVLFLDPRLPPY